MADEATTPDEQRAAIAELEAEVAALTARVNALRRESEGNEVPDYPLWTMDGEVRLSDLFAGRDKLLAIHNMGQGCRYCTLWADGFNGFLPHLESEISVVLLSKDPPEEQRRFAASRGWRFRLASHRGGDYMREQSTSPDYPNMPGAVLYAKRNGAVLRKNAVVFGPGDMFCPVWNFLAMAGYGVDDWTPQFAYWRRPRVLDDGGLNVIE